MDWNNRTTWRVLLAALLGLGLAWIAASRVPDDQATARSARPPAPQEGFAAPDFSLETLDGATLRLAGLRGQAVLLNFWATWCPPCRAEMPAMQRTYQSYRDQGLAVLAVNMQESETQVDAFAAELGLTFPILMDRDGSLAARYRVQSLPTTFFIDRAGTIQQVTLGGPMPAAFIESQVAGLLASGGD